MRRLLATAAVLAAVAALAVVATGAGGGADDTEYRVEFDNAFGLIEGGDLKIAGVRAGQITEIAYDRASKRALVGFRVDKEGFGSLRTDTRCAIEPQSLIGEYFVDCDPGEAPGRLPEGARIPVERTTSTIPPDLVNNILRRPYRERLRIIVDELGAAVAGNAGNLNAAIRRASPALRETNRVLAVLAEQNQVLADLARDADTVLSDLAGNRRDVGRWVEEARDTAAISARRRDAIAEGFERLPGFLGELRPTMRSLGEAADAQAPALRDLQASAGELQRLFDELGPFADASLPALRALGEASSVGRRTVRVADATVAQLAAYAEGTPELARNLAIVLEHLDDREHAVEADPRSPGGKGYTGLEALLQYVFDQALSTNIFDRENHLLKVAPFESPCAQYQSAESLEEAGEEGDRLLEQCAANLGPNQPGINFPDRTKDAEPQERASRRRERGRPETPRREERPRAAPAPAPPAGAAPRDRDPALPTVDDLLPGLQDTLEGAVPRLRDRVGGTRPRSGPSGGESAGRLLDYLLRP